VSTLFDGALVTEIDGCVAGACDCGVASDWIATCVYRIGSLQDGVTRPPTCRYPFLFPAGCIG
jgi:hypothetical protein